MRVAPKRPLRLASAQNDRIWAAVGVTELDLAAAPNGGDARGGLPSDDYAVRPSAACADSTARSYVSLGG